ncbi:MAG TPA: bifunctional alpha/beta hydrolase/OsmC family protein [Longimicrobiales bacterium]|nr:bifunctional alpha/beta hydrolase/OsmC family protein [Longimicrobiales bacterium]
MTTRRLTFPGSAGADLAAILDTPADGRADACAVFAHCFTCSKDLKAVVAISRTLVRRRIAVLRFDFTGLGQSEGDFAETTFSSNVEDLVLAAEHLDTVAAAPSILIGHSLGGAAVLQAAHRLPSVVAVATIAAPADPAHVLRLVESSREEIERLGVATVRIAGRAFRIRREFLDDLQPDVMRRAIGDLRRALLVMHSPVDEVVGIDNAARIYEAARHPKSFVSLDDADHLLGDPADARYVAEVLAAWAGRYVAPPQDEAPPPAGSGVVSRTPEVGYRTDLVAGPHTLVADEPVAVGGTDEGPTPYDLLAAALGACTGMTLRMYADRKEWPLEEVLVKVTHGRVHAEHGGACEDPGSCIEAMRREIRIEGPDLDATQRERLLEIADRCPVHRTLEGGVKISTEEVAG